jgi:glycerol-3-phosphate dehydrogenase
VVWVDKGLVTISGGKLTTFPMMARRALAAAAPLLSGRGGDELPRPEPGEAVDRLTGRYGPEAPVVLALAGEGEPETVEGTSFLWAELRHAARSEQVVHLEDLMLRRTRLGLLLEDGGAPLLDRVRQTVQADLGWSDERWEAEEEAYRRLWREAYSPALLD